uniref:Uncharacterized protein n=1 Tax=Candidatus Methanogaster sp. ANME-2c ERB4 TaxID=2759911 RepID=A0A7G9Y671_9EURY|nr:hypothetical protein MFIFEMKC_00001 [Methanosarcinales archaeon ANME-2c ERB4]
MDPHTLIDPFQIFYRLNQKFPVQSTLSTRKSDPLHLIYPLHPGKHLCNRFRCHRHAACECHYMVLALGAPVVAAMQEASNLDRMCATLQCVRSSDTSYQMRSKARYHPQGTAFPHCIDLHTLHCLGHTCRFRLGIDHHRTGEAAPDSTRNRDRESCKFQCIRYRDLLWHKVDLAIDPDLDQSLPFMWHHLDRSVRTCEIAGSAADTVLAEEFGRAGDSVPAYPAESAEVRVPSGDFVDHGTTICDM